MQCKHKSILLYIPPETAKFLHHDIFWFFLHDEEFESKTINNGNVHLEKFPASKVRQLAKKVESSKATAKHIKQVAGDPQAVQINLMRHQPTELAFIRKTQEEKAICQVQTTKSKNAGNKNQQVSSQEAF